MSNIISRIDSLSEKIAKLKKAIRVDSLKSKSKKADEKADAAVVDALKTAIAPSSTKSKKRNGNPIRKAIATMTIEKKSDGTQIEKTKTTEKIFIHPDDRNNRQSSRDPSKLRNDSLGAKHKKPLALSLQKPDR